jgi:methionyl-tRNA formyltransferase
MRILIFSDVNGPTTARLVRATLRLASRGSPYRVVGIVTTRPGDFRSGLSSRVRGLARRAVVLAANRDVGWRGLLGRRLDLYRLGRRQGFPLVVPPTGDINDPAFIADLRADVRPDIALSFSCMRRFGRPLRSLFAAAVNYHDGLAPEYRGVMATSFSIFAGERQSGLTFHHMTGRIDGGPLLHQDSVPIDEQSTLDEVVDRKSLLAAAAMPRVLERVDAGDPGRPQVGKGSYFSVPDWTAMTHLAHPGNATRAEILRRIRAFGVVHLEIDGACHPVTRLRPARRGDSLAFRTADGHRLAPDRFLGLPALFYRPPAASRVARGRR